MATNFFPATATVNVVVKNPKRPGSAAATRYALYRNGKTVAALLKAGLLTIDFSFDAARGYVYFTGANGAVIAPPASAVKAAGKAANPVTKAPAKAPRAKAPKAPASLAYSPPATGGGATGGGAAS